MRQQQQKQMTREELLHAYVSKMQYFKAHNIKRPFSTYTELFWILFDDGTNSYTWAIDTLCDWFPECDKEELEKVLGRYI